MSSATLYRWSGIVLLLGSLLGVIASTLDSVLNPSHDLTAQQVLSTPYIIIASLFLVIADSAMAARCIPCTPGRDPPFRCG